MKTFWFNPSIRLITFKGKLKKKNSPLSCLHQCWHTVHLWTASTAWGFIGRRVVNGGRPMKFNQARPAVIGPREHLTPPPASAVGVWAECAVTPTSSSALITTNSTTHTHTHSHTCLFISRVRHGEYYYWVIKSVYSCMTDVAHGVERATVDCQLKKTF